MNRDKRINLQATEAEQDMLRELAEREGVTMSNYVRQFIRRQHAEIFGAQARSAAKHGERPQPASKARKRK